MEKYLLIVREDLNKLKKMSYEERKAKSFSNVGMGVESLAEPETIRVGCPGG